MVSQKVQITNPTGLHLRPAGIFSNIANKFECRITFEYENSIANAKSEKISKIIKRKRHYPKHEPKRQLLR